MDQQPIITILVGCPGSGKSTYVESVSGDNIICHINQDKQGKQGHLELFNKAMESKTTNIIIDRMNFNKGQRNRYLDPAKAAGYRTRIIVFHVPKDICLERCLKRENHPTIKDSESAHNAVNFFFKNYERVQDDEADEVIRLGWVDEKAPKVVVCDLDGTMCNLDKRLHWVRNEDKKQRNWKKFFEEIPEDSVNEWCQELMYQMSRDNKVVYASGRPDTYKDITLKWLDGNYLLFPNYELYMRMGNDHRADTVVKEIILEFELKTRYNILFTVDDRAGVVEMWRKHGITCLQCAEGDF